MDQNQTPEAVHELGLSHAQAGRWAEAGQAFERFILLRPDQAHGYANLGNVLLQLGRVADAERAFTIAIRLQPADPRLHVRVGNLLKQMGRPLEALVSADNALRFQPEALEALRLKASLLFDLGRADQSVAAWRQLLGLAPNDAEAANDLGNALRSLDLNEQAEAQYRHAIACKPALSPAYANLGNLFAEQGRSDEARASYRQAHQLQPLHRLRVLSELVLPVIYQSVEHIAAARRQFDVALQDLAATGVRVDPTRELLPTHFYLAYQGHNDRDLHEAVAKLAPVGQGFQPDTPRASGTRKIRIGVLSRYLRNHTIGQLNHGLIANLSRDHFEVTVLSLGPPTDDLARRIQHSADRYLVLPPHLPAALKMTADLRLDVLYYPDIGMDTQTYTMAFSRLAPVQCVAWGHPVTTGLKTMDYFLSSVDLDPPGAEGAYTEKLVRLPRLGVYYERPQLGSPARDRAYFRLPDHAHLYVCPQTLFKFHPEFDALLAGILRHDKQGRLVLIEGKYTTWWHMLRQRFQQTMPDVLDRVIVLPRQPRPDFLHLLALADVLLDPIHFGGGNTSYEALGLGTPIVTWPSAFLRGRLTYAMYRQMGLGDLIVHNAADYIARAVHLGTDPAWRQEMKQRIQQQAGVLFEDKEAIKGVEEFLERVAAI